MNPILKVLITLVCYLSLFVAADYSIRRWWLDHTHWFNYEKVVFEKPVIAGKPIYMISHIEWLRPTNVHWVHSLYCRNADRRNFAFIDQVILEAIQHFPETSNPEPWKFVTAPAAGAECYVRSQISAHVGYGLQKVQIVKSDRVFVE